MLKILTPSAPVKSNLPLIILEIISKISLMAKAIPWTVISLHLETSFWTTSRKSPLADSKKKSTNLAKIGISPIARESLRISALTLSTI